MYLHQTLANTAPAGTAGSSAAGETNRVDAYISSKIGEELRNAAIVRETMRDTTSALLQIKGPKQAAAVEKAQLHVLRSELEAFPEGLRENARTNFLLDQNIKRKNLQDFQCVMMGRIESLLRAEMLRNGVNYRKYKVGGYDSGTYELFFRIQPGHFMTKAQLITALRRSFGDQLIRSKGAIGQLFDSFDFFRADEMDWRAFLYLLCLLMMPYLYCEDLLRYGYALYSSIGSLDLDCAEKLSMGMLKDMLCAPVILSLRSELRIAFDKAWMELSDSDTAVFQYAARNQTHASRVDPDEFRIPFAIFRKMLTETFFSRYLRMALPFGRRDGRMWTCVLEEQYYHPRVLLNLKNLRREERSQKEADEFIAKADLRKKGFCFRRLIEFMQQRVQLRLVLIGVEVRSVLQVMGNWFDRWKAVCMEITSRMLLQRWGRGFIARRRRRFLLRLKKRVTLAQSSTRKLLTRIDYHQKVTRIRWAATTIQRLVRGRSARKRVATRVQAFYDASMRKLQHDRRAWENWRHARAAIAIQIYIRRFLRRRRRMRVMAEQARIAKVQREMDEQFEASRVQQHVFMSEITDWYKARKEKNDLEVFHEHQTAQQKRAIMERRAAFAKEAERIAKEEREAKMKRLEEEQQQRWEKDWEAEIKRRAESKRQKLGNILLLPESQAELLLKKELEKRIRTQIKDVLRRADKQKIPMEIPEAKEIASKEVIEQEVEKEIAKARVEKATEAKRLQAEKEAKLLKEKNEALMEKKRRRKWALLTMQGYARAFIARRRGRERAYQRYIKHFDIATHEYYYEDKRTRITTWKKPRLLGNYELPMESYWIAIPAGDGTVMDVTSSGGSMPLRYFYNPSSWEQRWEQPYGTILCEQCGIYFAAARMSGAGNSKLKYCESCFHSHVQMLLHQKHMLPKNIHFRLFNGGKEDVKWLKLNTVPVTNWHAHLLTIDPKLLAHVDEEDEGDDGTEDYSTAASSQHKKQKTKKKRKKKKQKLLENGEGEMLKLPSIDDHRRRIASAPLQITAGDGSASAGSGFTDDSKAKKKKKIKKKGKKAVQRESRSAGLPQHLEAPMDVDGSSIISPLTVEPESRPHSAINSEQKKRKDKKKKKQKQAKGDSRSEGTGKSSGTKKKKKKKTMPQEEQQPDNSSWMSPLSGDDSSIMSPATALSSEVPKKKKEKRPEAGGKKKAKKKKKKVLSTDNSSTAADTRSTTAAKKKKKKKNAKPSDASADYVSTDGTASKRSKASKDKRKKKKKAKKSDESGTYISAGETSKHSKSSAAGSKGKKKKKKKSDRPQPT